ncbi:MAG TPA: V-type ATP synthase subunit E family protein [Acholeplasmataceae bacterium]|nr:V-type ATP synthase subunit E family protein [Acholeplasmataceae bacterium]HQC30258.1 V-type ATP synthase subunit E family protein [Acholeplasmataceae bacterium]
MEKKNLTDYIVSKGKEEAKQIKAEADKAALKVERDILNKAEEEAKRIILSASTEADYKVSTLEMTQEIERRKALLRAKSEVINEVFQQAYQKIKNLPDKEFLSLIISLIKKEKYSGKEEIMVNKDEFNKYEALIPKINQELKTEFKLSKKPALIDSGFLMVGKYYDLNFDFMELINEVRREYESKLSEELFK